MRNDAEIDKGWSEEVLMDFLVDLFKDKLAQNNDVQCRYSKLEPFY